MDTEKQNENWYYWGRWIANVLFHSLYFRYNKTEIVKQNPVFHLETFQVLDGYYYFKQEDLDRISFFVEDIFENDLAWFKNFFSSCEERISSVKKITKDTEINDFFKCIIEALTCSMTIELIDYATQRYIKEKAERNGVPEDQVFACIFPSKDTLLMGFNKKIRDLSDINIDIILKEYEWVGTHAFSGNPLTKEKLALLKQTAAQEIDSASQKQPEGFEKIIAIASELAFYRSYIIENVNKIAYYYWPTLNAWAQKNNLSFEDMTYLTVDELEAINKGSNVQVSFKSRKEAFGIIFEQDAMRVIEKLELHAELKKHEITIDSDIKEVRGMPAYKGIVRGAVRIIEAAIDIDKLKSGEILVTNETTPDFILAMREAAAIITNIGGITSHAAIVARELKKPCIVGTKIASKIFKDGEMVEVDANRGIISRLV